MDKRSTDKRSAGKRATDKKTQSASKDKRKTHQANKCRFCRAKVENVDYKDIGTLKKLITPQGKMFSRKRAGNCAYHQRAVKQAVKRARFLALLPYVG